MFADFIGSISLVFVPCLWPTQLYFWSQTPLTSS